MTTRRAAFVVNAGGVAQGLALVAFPASEPVFLRSVDGFGLSATQYGQLFIPQVVVAVVTSLGGGAAGRRFGIKRVLLAGLAADLMAMALFTTTAGLVDDERAAAHVVVLIATGFLGAGFGLSVPALNSFAADLAASDPDQAVLTLNALLGLGTVLAPVLGTFFLRSGFWWGLPVLAGTLVLATAACVVPLATPRPPAGTGSGSWRDLLRVPVLWLILAAALTYGVVETMAGTWGTPVARTGMHLPTSTASIVLAVFWGSVTGGRLAFARLERVVAPRVLYCVLPWVVALGLALVEVVPSGSTVAAVAVFALIGIGCSALLPGTVSLAQARFPAMAAAVSALVIAGYQVGYGIAAFGVGPLQDDGVDLTQAFGLAALAAVVLGLVAVTVTVRMRTATTTSRGDAHAPATSSDPA